MEVITNKYLAYFNLENLAIFNDENQSVELNDIDQKQTKKFLSESLKRTGAKSNENEFIKSVSSEDERMVLRKLMHLNHYYPKAIRKKVERQKNVCEEFIKTDMCLRNSELKKQVKVEIEKLNLALKYDFVSIAINSLYDLYSYLYPNESDVDISVRISETMYHLSFYRSKNKPFLTLQQSQYYLDENPDVNMYDGKQKIYHRIKDDLIKNRNRFLLR